LVVFVGVPFAEIYVLLQVGHAIGVLNTLALLILVSMVGAWLAKREGLGVIRRVQDALNAGRVPAAELVDGFLILLAAALMITPGFLTDIAAILALIPATSCLLFSRLAASLYMPKPIASQIINRSRRRWIY